MTPAGVCKKMILTKYRLWPMKMGKRTSLRSDLASLGPRFARTRTDADGQCCENVVKMLRKYCENVAKRLRKCCERLWKGGGNVAEMLRKCCENVANMLRKCCENVAKMLRKCCENVTKMSRKCNENVTNMSWKRCEKSRKCPENDIMILWFYDIMILWWYDIMMMWNVEKCRFFEIRDFLNLIALRVLTTKF